MNCEGGDRVEAVTIPDVDCAEQKPSADGCYSELKWNNLPEPQLGQEKSIEVKR